MVKTHAQPYKHIIHTNAPNSLSRRTAITRRTHCHAGQQQHKINFYFNCKLVITACDQRHRCATEIITATGEDGNCEAQQLEKRPTSRQSF